MGRSETLHIPRLVDPAELFEPQYSPQYWHGARDRCWHGDKTRMRDAPVVYLQRIALALFNKHVGAALHIPPFSNESKPTHQAMESGSTLDISKLAIGTLVTYDTERLAQDNQASKRHPSQVVDTAHQTHVRYRVNEPGSDFIGSHTTRLKQPEGSKVWVPRSMTIIPNAQVGSAYREYIREAGVAMVLPGKKNLLKLFRPECLYLESRGGGDIGFSRWEAVALPVDPTIEQTNWVSYGRRKPLVPERLRDAWLYQASAAEWAGLDLPAPYGRASEALITIGRHSAPQFGFNIPTE